MGPLVIDASVLVAVLVEDPLSTNARTLLGRALDEGSELHAPDLIVAEVGNALWKAVRGERIAATDAMSAMREALALAALRLHPLEPLAGQPLALALAHDVTAYDACYLALATLIGATLVTGDRRLSDRAAHAAVPVKSVVG